MSLKGLDNRVVIDTVIDTGGAADFDRLAQVNYRGIFLNLRERLRTAPFMTGGVFPIESGETA